MIVLKSPVFSWTNVWEWKKFIFVITFHRKLAYTFFARVFKEMTKLKKLTKNPEGWAICVPFGSKSIRKNNISAILPSPLVQRKCLLLFNAGTPGWLISCFLYFYCSIEVQCMLQVKCMDHVVNVLYFL